MRTYIGTITIAHAMYAYRHKFIYVYTKSTPLESLLRSLAETKFECNLYMYVLDVLASTCTYTHNSIHSHTTFSIL